MSERCAAKGCTEPGTYRVDGKLRTAYVELVIPGICVWLCEKHLDKWDCQTTRICKVIIPSTEGD